MYRQNTGSIVTLLRRSILHVATVWISAIGLPAQTATVLADGTSVYSRVSAQSARTTTLPKGQELKVQMTVSGASGCWLDVSWGKSGTGYPFTFCIRPKSTGAGRFTAERIQFRNSFFYTCSSKSASHHG